MGRKLPDTHKPVKRILSSIRRVGLRLDLGKTTIHKLIDEGQLDVVRIGRRTLITEESIARLTLR